MARKFSFTKEQWLKTLEKERNVKAAAYRRDIIWPTLALRELAKHQLTVTRQELDDAYESEFGPSVKVRLIAIQDPKKAKQIHAQAVAKPEDFPALAKNHSQDTNSASAYGLIQPIRRHMGDPQLETEAFRLKKGEISKIVPVGEMQVFVKCEEHLPPTKGVDRSKAEPLLEEALKDRKLRSAAGDVFKDLQKNAVVENILNDPRVGRGVHGTPRRRGAGRDDQSPTARTGAAQAKAGRRRWRPRRRNRPRGPVDGQDQGRRSTRRAGLAGTCDNGREYFARSLSARPGLAFGRTEETGRR
jgi:hypothetical protein